MWLPTNPQNPAAQGSPVVIEVKTATSISTEILVTIPGIWVQQVTYGASGGAFMKISLPPVEVKGVGYPAQNGQRGWWDFPEAKRQALRNPNAFVKAGGGVMRFAVPPSAAGANPTTVSEMQQLGIDPAGARPGLPRVRVPVAISRANANQAGSINAQIVATAAPSLYQLPQPVLPAGYDGVDAEPAEGGYAAPQLIDTAFYSQQSFSPEYSGTENLIGPLETIRGPFTGSWLSIPIASMTSPKGLKIIPSFRVVIDHFAGIEDFACDLSADVLEWMPAFVNGAAFLDGLALKGLEVEASRSARYLIVCPKSWHSTLQEFAQWKEAKGLHVDYLHVGMDGDVANDRLLIDQRIESYFLNHYCHGVYVLICGDVDVIASGRGGARTTGDPDGADALSDHRYETLSGDRHACVYVGRLSANSTGELKTQLDKILKYERAPFTGSWPAYVALCANSETDSGARGVTLQWPSKYARCVEEAVNYAGYTSPPGFITLHAGASSFIPVRADNQSVIDTLNDGCGQMFYRGHGNGSSWLAGWDGSSENGSAWSITDHVSTLSNQVKPIVYSIACLNNRLSLEDCIGEAWMSRVGGGAVAHYGASVVSYTAENHERLKGILRAVYEQGYTRLGPMLSAAESLSFAATGGGASWDNNTFCYILLGDPEMEIRKTAVPPRYIGSLLNPALQAVTGGSKVRITDASGAVISGVLVNVVMADGTKLNSYTDELGEAFFAVEPSAVSRLDLQREGFPVGAKYLRTPVLKADGFVNAPTGARGFKLRLADASQGVFRVQAASDPGGNWTDLGTAQPTGKDQEFTDENSGSHTRRFYRAVQEP